jgi:RimJ/RimL family protein N-acetyltransferase
VRPTADDLRARLTGRLVLVEPLSDDHETGLLEAARDANLFQWLPDDLSGSRDQFRAWLTASLEASQTDREVAFAILAAHTGEVVGSTRFLEIRLEHLRVEIGWTWLARAVWGTGVNVESKLLLLGHAFEVVGCRRVEFKTDARNERSRGALEALGAHFEGTLRKHMVDRQGHARDSAYYSVIDDEWPQVKARLEGRLASLAGKRA